MPRVIWKGAISFGGFGPTARLQQPVDASGHEVFAVAVVVATVSNPRAAARPVVT